MRNRPYLLGLSIALVGAFAVKTAVDIQPIDQLYWRVVRSSEAQRITDRYGQPLLIRYDTAWNYDDQRSLHQFPDFLIKATIVSEDKSFYQHRGIEWPAKAAAVWQNIKARRVVRGASTITEQVVHLLNPRPRSLWSKWLEMIEAQLLERKLSKNHILEFYLNQVPYTANRHGVSQGAHFYFNRDLSTLTPKEILALVILVKAPTSYDLRKSTHLVEARMLPLVERLELDAGVSAQIKDAPLQLESRGKIVDAYHFVQYFKRHRIDQAFHQRQPLLRTTLDGSLQDYCQQVLDQRLRALKDRKVGNAAILVVDHHNGDILAWVVGGRSLGQGQTRGGMIDSISALRQPGSALKPFVYAAALEKGWKATTLIDDAPLTGPVGTGMHRFKNYSNIHYGPVTVREALANSLNVPAVKAIQHVGVNSFLQLLHQLQFTTLKRGSEIYDEGLALGNGEVSLFELVRAYGVLANKGLRRTLRFTFNDSKQESAVRVFPETVTSIIGDILSDPWARRLEFGSASIMNLPVQTAVKTGTSTDYRDAWIVGYNHRYVVGVWMGNLDNEPMDGVTGSTGPALTMRVIFNHLNRNQESKSLYLSPELSQRDVLIKKGNKGEESWQTELFDGDEAPGVVSVAEQRVVLLKPTPGLKMAVDPRVPLTKQKFEFKLTSLGDGDVVEWYVDDVCVDTTSKPSYLWPLQQGRHLVRANVRAKGEIVCQVPEVGFWVK